MKKWYFTVLLMAGTHVPAFFALTPQQVVRALWQLQPPMLLSACQTLVQQYGAIDATCADRQQHEKVLRHYRVLHLFFDDLYVAHDEQGLIYQSAGTHKKFLSYWREHDADSYYRFYEQYFSSVAYCFILSVQEAYVHRHEESAFVTYVSYVEALYAQLSYLLSYLQGDAYYERYRQQMTRYQTVCVQVREEIP